MLEAMKTAAIVQKAWSNDPTILPLQDLIEMATVNGAKALGVHTHDEAGDEFLDDLAESQRHDGEVVAVETQDWDADEKAHNGSAQGAHDHGKRTQEKV